MYIVSTAAHVVIRGLNFQKIVYKHGDADPRPPPMEGRSTYYLVESSISQLSFILFYNVLFLRSHITPCHVSVTRTLGLMDAFGLQADNHYPIR